MILCNVLMNQCQPFVCMKEAKFTQLIFIESILEIRTSLGPEMSLTSSRYKVESLQELKIFSTFSLPSANHFMNAPTRDIAYQDTMFILF